HSKLGADIDFARTRLGKKSQQWNIDLLITETDPHSQLQRFDSTIPTTTDFEHRHPHTFFPHCSSSPVLSPGRNATTRSFQTMPPPTRRVRPPPASPPRIPTEFSDSEDS